MFGSKEIFRIFASVWAGIKTGTMLSALVAIRCITQYMAGDVHGRGRVPGMLCDAQAQYGDYSELEKCPMWGMWEKGKNELGIK